MENTWAGSRPDDISFFSCDGMTPLMVCAAQECAGLYGGLMRLLLHAGADPDLTDDAGRDALTYARARLARQSRYSYDGPPSTILVDLLQTVKDAGGWRRYVLGPHHSVLAMRKLCERGRATVPDDLRRLFDLPQELFWKVLEFKFGDYAALPYGPCPGGRCETCKRHCFECKCNRDVYASTGAVFCNCKNLPPGHPHRGPSSNANFCYEHGL